MYDVLLCIAGRGAEIGETLDEDESQHLGKRVSLVLPDPEDVADRAAAKKAGNKAAARRPANPLRLLRGHSGAKYIYIYIYETRPLLDGLRTR